MIKQNKWTKSCRSEQNAPEQLIVLLSKNDVRQRVPGSKSALKYTAEAAQIIHQLCLLNQDGSSFLPSL